MGAFKRLGFARKLKRAKRDARKPITGRAPGSRASADVGYVRGRGIEAGAVFATPRNPTTGLPNFQAGMMRSGLQNLTA